MIFPLQFGINKNGHVQFCWSLKKFTRSYLLEIAPEIMWLPVQMLYNNTQQYWNEYSD